MAFVKDILSSRRKPGSIGGLQGSGGMYGFRLSPE
jgi:hypothetical protein